MTRKPTEIHYTDATRTIGTRGNTLVYVPASPADAAELDRTEGAGSTEDLTFPESPVPPERWNRIATIPVGRAAEDSLGNALRYGLGIGRLGRRLVRGGIRHVVAVLSDCTGRSGAPGHANAPGTVDVPGRPTAPGTSGSPGHATVPGTSGASAPPTIIAVAGKRFYQIAPATARSNEHDRTILSPANTAASGHANPAPAAYTVIPGAETVGSNPLCTPAVVPLTEGGVPGPAGPAGTAADSAAEATDPRSAITASGSGRESALVGTAIYYGEYRANPERSPVHVWRSTDGAATFHPAWTFTDVRHVHGVFADPFDPGVLWVTTGDDDTESAIWRTTDSFATLEPVVRGGQQARAVDLVFTADAVYFGSDTPREQNYLYRLDRRAAAVERQQAVSGSVFWGRSTPDGWRLFSTVVEKSNINTARHAELWAAPPDRDEWRCLYRARKDAFHDKYFDHGQLRFPAGPGQPGTTWVTPYAVRGDQRSLYIELASRWADAPEGAVR